MEEDTYRLRLRNTNIILGSFTLSDGLVSRATDQCRWLLNNNFGRWESPLNQDDGRIKVMPETNAEMLKYIKEYYNDDNVDIITGAE